MIPFKYHGNSLGPDLNNCRRLKLYRKFIGEDTLGLSSLDVGEPGYISKELCVEDNTLPCDFNYALLAPAENYRCITCFEVLNHVMNPLRLMVDIRALLADDGVCYLSVPKLWLIAWHHCKYNFVMYSPERLRLLFEYAGFRVVRTETVNPWPARFVFYGVRPVFRLLFNRISLFELRKC